MAGTSCVDDEVIESLLDGSLEDPRAAEDHVAGCTTCSERVEAAKVRRLPTQAEAAATGKRRERKLPAVGQTVGRFVIAGKLGAGGMGVVFLAHDPQLDRKVAVKLLTGGARRAADSPGQSRLLREAQAMARLNHPNVITVYEVGEHENDVFIAMELVEGSTLKDWLTAQPRTQDEILRVMRAAGAGLAAAHRAGVIHRDFKPDNVLVSNSGEVRVSDFGLARAVDAMHHDEDAGPSPSSPSSSVLSSPITQVGTLIGTPAYMAPEQFTGEVVDARSDQFAFCVALYEALYGERPFQGATFDELRSAVMEGRVTSARALRVAPRVRRAIRRGLAVSPADRFATMDALLGELAPRRSRTWLALGGGVLVAGAAAATMMIARPAASEVCRGGAAEVGAVWNAGRRAQMQQAFTAAGGAEAFTQVARELDKYFAGWAKMSGESCEATRVHGQQSEIALDLRSACLERRRAEADALLDVLAHADASTVAHARDAVAELTPISTCVDVAVLSRVAPEPIDPTLRLRTDRARAQTSVANYQEAGPALDAIAAAPELAKMPTLEAEVQWMRAKIAGAKDQMADAEAALFRGLAKAQAARADELVAMISIDLAHAVGFQGQRFADGLRWVELAAAAIEAKGGDALMKTRLATIRGVILQRAGKYAEAEAVDREALALALRVAPGTSLEGEAQNTLAMVLAMEGKLDEARPAFERALVLVEETYGARHSLTATAHMNLAGALGTSNQFAAARPHYQAALEINEAVFGKDSLKVGAVLSNYGQMLQEAGETADARAALERALAIREAGLPPDDPSVAKTAANLGYVLLDEKAYQRAIEMFTRVGAILDKRFGAKHPARADDLSGLGLAWIGLGKPERAIAPLSRAVGLVGADGDPVNLASIRANLGRALFASGKDRAGGAAMGRAARAVLAEAGETNEVEELDRWLPRR